MSLMSRPRRRVSYTQMEALWETLNKNRSLATGYNKTCHARELSRKMWERIERNLNSISDGATKDWRAWSKYWNDYKSKLKSRVARKRSSHQHTGDGLSKVSHLSDLEEKFLQILEEDFGSGTPEDRAFDDTPPVDHPSEKGPISLILHWPQLNQTVEVLGDGHEVKTDGEERQQLRTPSPVTPAVVPGMAPRSPRLVLRRCSSTTAAVPSAPPSQRNPQRIQQHAMPRLVRKRQRRGEAHMTQEAARRALVADSQERIRLSREKLYLLRNLVMELKEIKHIINLRLPVPATANK